jgi:hypothetical protein
LEKKIVIVVAYSLNKGHKETSHPEISLDVENGAISPESQIGGWGNDVVSFQYTGKTPGNDKIFAFVNEIDGSDMTTVRVTEDCQYSYQLYLRLHITNNFKGTSYESQDVILAEGTLTPFPPGKRVLGISPLRGSTSPRSVT